MRTTPPAESRASRIPQRQRHRRYRLRELPVDADERDLERKRDLLAKHWWTGAGVDRDEANAAVPGCHRVGYPFDEVDHRIDIVKFRIRGRTGAVLSQPNISDLANLGRDLRRGKDPTEARFGTLAKRCFGSERGVQVIVQVVLRLEQRQLYLLWFRVESPGCPRIRSGSLRLTSQRCQSRHE